MPRNECAPDAATSEAREEIALDWKPWETLFAEGYEAHAYSVKAWYTHGRAKPQHGADPLEPREPAYYGPEVRLAARMCDLGYSPRFSHLSLEELAEVAARYGLEETEAEKSRRHGIELDRWQEFTSSVGVFSVESIFDTAELTGAERKVMELVLDGRDQSQIAEATDKALGTVKVLRKRATDKLRALAGAAA